MTTQIFVERAYNSDSYMAVTRTQLEQIKRPLILEGVDGDEATDTVTYWYRNAYPGVEV